MNELVRMCRTAPALAGSVKRITASTDAGACAAEEGARVALMRLYAWFRRGVFAVAREAGTLARGRARAWAVSWLRREEP